MAETDIAVIELPFEVVKNSGGFAMDMGGSVAKVVYRDKQDWDFENGEPKKVNGSFAHVRAFMFAREKRKEILSYIQEHCHITHVSDDKTLIYTTGIGGHEYGKELGPAFNVSLKNLTEMDCFVKAFRYLCKHMPEHKLLHDVPPVALERFRLKVEQVQTVLKKSEEGNLTEGKWEIMRQSKEEQLKATYDEQATGLSAKHDSAYGKDYEVYPCMLGMLGSAIGFMTLDKDGTFAIVDMSNRGGRLFLGLGSILTGAKSFEQLMELAEKGDQKNVHTYSEDFKIDESAGDHDMYANKADDFMVFCFGKGVYKNIGDFRKEDLARTLLHYICIDLAQCSHLTMMSHNIKSIYLCGGFGNSPLVREFFTEEFLIHTLYRGEVGQRGIRFVKNGSYLGAIGAFMEGYPV